MRILHVNTEHGWRGGERQTLLTVQGLVNAGLSAGLVAQPDAPLIKAAQRANIEVFPLKMHGSANYRAAMRLRKIIKNFKANLVHLQTSHAANLGLLARGLRKKPKLVLSRRVDFPISSSWKYNRFNAVIAISNAVSKVLIKSRVKREKISVISSGVSTQVEQAVHVAETRMKLAGNASHLIGTIGHLAEHKGHRYLLEAMPKVLENYPALKLIIIGGGELMDDLQDRTRFLEIEKNVIFTGFREDVNELIFAFDLYIQPSVLEGLCTTLFDVMLRGVPIVASNVGGMPEALNNGRFAVLAPATEPAILAEKIIGVLGDKKIQTRITAGAAQWTKENFSVESMVNATLTLYQQILAQ